MLKIQYILNENFHQWFYELYLKSGLLKIVIQYQKQEKNFNIKAHFNLFIHGQDLIFK